MTGRDGPSVRLRRGGMRCDAPRPGNSMREPLNSTESHGEQAAVGPRCSDRHVNYQDLVQINNSDVTTQYEVG
jgi:hypothetical protein